MWFKIYYDPTDDSLPDVVEGWGLDDAMSATPRGVIALVTYVDGRRQIHCRRDWYGYHTVAREWWSMDRDGMIDNLISHPGLITAHKMGRTLTNEQFREILRRVERENPEVKP